MRKLIVPLILLMPVFGAAHESQPLDREALRQRLKFYSQVNELETTFSQTKFLSDMGVELKSEGRFQLRRPQQVVWEIVKPGRVRIEMTRDEIVVTSGEGASQSKRVLKVSAIPDEKDIKSLKNLVSWLELDAQALSEEYSVFAVGKQAFRFVPKNAKLSAFKELEMTLANGGHLSRLVIHEPSGDRMDITFGTPRKKHRK